MSFFKEYDSKFDKFMKVFIWFFAVIATVWLFTLSYVWGKNHNDLMLATCWVITLVSAIASWYSAIKSLFL